MQFKDSNPNVKQDIDTVLCVLEALPCDEEMSMIPGGDGLKTSGLTRVLLNNKLTIYLMDAMVGQLKE